MKPPQIHTKSRFLTRVFAGGLCLVYFTTQCALAYSPETIWLKRRAVSQKTRETPLQLAKLPISLPSTNNQYRYPQIEKEIKESRLQRLLQQKAKSSSSARDDKFSPTLKDLIASLPENYGTLRDIVTPSKTSAGKIVIHIQDIHANAEAQTNISKTIQDLMLKKKVDLIALEGNSERIDLSRLQNFSDQNAVKMVADYLLRENLISGPIQAALHQPKNPVVIVGVEDQTLYEKNVRAVQESTPRADSTKKHLQIQLEEINKEKEASLNPALRAFDKTRQAYHNGTISLGNYVKQLGEKNLELSLALQSFLEAFELEEHLDLKQVERERSHFFTKLAPRLSPIDIENLTQLSVNFRLNQITAKDFYTIVKNLCQAHKISLRQFPTFNNYIRYVLLSDSLKADEILRDLKHLEQKTLTSLIKNPREQKLMEDSKILELSQKLVDFSLTAQEWEELKLLSPSLALSVKGGILPLLTSPALAGEGYNIVPLPGTGRVREGVKSSTLKPFLDFYQAAESRNVALTANLLEQMAQQKASVAVLVTGGFHSEEINKKLSDTGITSLNFVPRITKVDSEAGAQYLSLFTQAKTPLDHLFEGEKLFLAQDPARGLNQVPILLAALLPNLVNSIVQQLGLVSRTVINVLKVTPSQVELRVRHVGKTTRVEVAKGSAGIMSARGFVDEKTLLTVAVLTVFSISCISSAIYPWLTVGIILMGAVIWGGSLIWKLKQKKEKFPFDETWLTNPWFFQPVPAISLSDSLTLTYPRGIEGKNEDYRKATVINAARQLLGIFQATHQKNPDINTTLSSGRTFVLDLSRYRTLIHRFELITYPSNDDRYDGDMLVRAHAGEKIYEAWLGPENETKKILAELMYHLEGNEVEVTSHSEISIPMTSIMPSYWQFWTTNPSYSIYQHYIHPVVASVLSRIIEKTGLNEPTVVDLGGGDGSLLSRVEYLFELAEHEQKPRFISIDKVKYENLDPEDSSVKIIEGNLTVENDIEKLAGQKADVITAMGLLNHGVVTPEQALQIAKNAFQALNPGGVLLLTGLTPLFITSQQLKDLGFEVRNSFFPSSFQNPQYPTQLYIAVKPESKTDSTNPIPSLPEELSAETLAALTIDELIIELSHPWTVRREAASRALAEKAHLHLDRLLQELRKPTILEDDPRILNVAALASLPDKERSTEKERRNRISRQNLRAALLFTFFINLKIRDRVGDQVEKEAETWSEKNIKRIEEIEKNTPQNALGTSEEVSLFELMVLVTRWYRKTLESWDPEDLESIRSSQAISPLHYVYNSVRLIHPDVDDKAGEILYRDFFNSERITNSLALSYSHLNKTAERLEKKAQGVNDEWKFKTLEEKKKTIEDWKKSLNDESEYIMRRMIAARNLIEIMGVDLWSIDYYTTEIPQKKEKIASERKEMMELRLRALEFLVANQQWVWKVGFLEDVIDLQVHTFFSDGDPSPTQLVFDAWRTGMHAIAINDHNTYDHFEEALRAAEIVNRARPSDQKLTVIPSVEYDFYEEELGIDEGHMMVYFPITLHEWPDLKKQLESTHVLADFERRFRWKLTMQHEMVRRFNEQFAEKLGSPLTEEDWTFKLPQFPYLLQIGQVIFRKYGPDKLSQVTGKTIQNAGDVVDEIILIPPIRVGYTYNENLFTRPSDKVGMPLIFDSKNNKSHHVNGRSLEWLIKTMKPLGGVVVLPHPSEKRYKGKMDEILRAYDLDGIELSGKGQTELKRAADIDQRISELNTAITNAGKTPEEILITVGSDSHGPRQQNGNGHVYLGKGFNGDALRKQDVVHAYPGGEDAYRRIPEKIKERAAANREKHSKKEEPRSIKPLEDEPSRETNLMTLPGRHSQIQTHLMNRIKKGIYGRVRTIVNVGLGLDLTESYPSPSPTFTELVESVTHELGPDIRVVGIDNDPKVIEANRKFFHQNSRDFQGRIEIVEGGFSAASQLLGAEKADVVVMLNVLTHYDAFSKPVALGHLAQSLREGGRVILGHDWSQSIYRKEADQMVLEELTITVPWKYFSLEPDSSLFSVFKNSSISQHETTLLKNAFLQILQSADKPEFVKSRGDTLKINRWLFGELQKRDFEVTLEGNDHIISVKPKDVRPIFVRAPPTIHPDLGILKTDSNEQNRKSALTRLKDSSNANIYREAITIALSDPWWEIRNQAAFILKDQPLPLDFLLDLLNKPITPLGISDPRLRKGLSYDPTLARLNVRYAILFAISLNIVLYKHNLQLLLDELTAKWDNNRWASIEKMALETKQNILGINHDLSLLDAMRLYLVFYGAQLPHSTPKPFQEKWESLSSRLPLADTQFIRMAIKTIMAISNDSTKRLMRTVFGDESDSVNPTLIELFGLKIETSQPSLSPAPSRETPMGSGYMKHYVTNIYLMNLVKNGWFGKIERVIDVGLGIPQKTSLDEQDGVKTAFFQLAHELVETVGPTVKIWGIDNNPDVIKRNEQIFKESVSDLEKNISIQQGGFDSVQNIVGNQKADLIFVRDVLTHYPIEERNAGLMHLARGLREGGHIVVGTMLFTVIFQKINAQLIPRQYLPLAPPPKESSYTAYQMERIQEALSSKEWDTLRAPLMNILKNVPEEARKNPEAFAAFLAEQLRNAGHNVTVVDDFFVVVDAPEFTSSTTPTPPTLSLLQPFLDLLAKNSPHFIQPIYGLIFLNLMMISPLWEEFVFRSLMIGTWHWNAWGVGALFFGLHIIVFLFAKKIDLHRQSERSPPARLSDSFYSLFKGIENLFLMSVVWAAGTALLTLTYNFHSSYLTNVFVHAAFNLTVLILHSRFKKFPEAYLSIGKKPKKKDPSLLDLITNKLSSVSHVSFVDIETGTGKFVGGFKNLLKIYFTQVDGVGIETKETYEKHKMVHAKARHNAGDIRVVESINESKLQSINITRGSQDIVTINIIDRGPYMDEQESPKLQQLLSFSDALLRPGGILIVTFGASDKYSHGGRTEEEVKEILGRLRYEISEQVLSDDFPISDPFHTAINNTYVFAKKIGEQLQDPRSSIVTDLISPILETRRKALSELINSPPSSVKRAKYLQLVLSDPDPLLAKIAAKAFTEIPDLETEAILTEIEDPTIKEVDRRWNGHKRTKRDLIRQRARIRANLITGLTLATRHHAYLRRQLADQAREWGPENIAKIERLTLFRKGRGWGSDEKLILLEALVQFMQYFNDKLVRNHKESKSKKDEPFMQESYEVFGAIKELSPFRVGEPLSKIIYAPFLDSKGVPKERLYELLLHNTRPPPVLPPFLSLALNTPPIENDRRSRMDLNTFLFFPMGEELFFRALLVGILKFDPLGVGAVFLAIHIVRLGVYKEEGRIRWRSPLTRFEKLSDALMYLNAQLIGVFLITASYHLTHSVLLSIVVHIGYNLAIEFLANHNPHFPRALLALSHHADDEDEVISPMSPMVKNRNGALETIIKDRKNPNQVNQMIPFLSDPSTYIRKEAANGIVYSPHISLAPLIKTLSLPQIPRKDPRLEIVSHERSRKQEILISRKNARLAVLFILGIIMARNFGPGMNIILAEEAAGWDEKAQQKIEKRAAGMGEHQFGINQELNFLQSIRLFSAFFEQLLRNQADDPTESTYPLIDKYRYAWASIQKIHPIIDDEIGKIIYAPFFTPGGFLKRDYYRHFLNLRPGQFPVSGSDRYRNRELSLLHPLFIKWWGDGWKTNLFDIFTSSPAETFLFKTIPFIISSKLSGSLIPPLQALVLFLLLHRWIYKDKTWATTFRRGPPIVGLMLLFLSFWSGLIDLFPFLSPGWEAFLVTSIAHSLLNLIASLHNNPSPMQMVNNVLQGTTQLSDVSSIDGRLHYLKRHASELPINESVFSVVQQFAIQNSPTKIISEMIETPIRPGQSGIVIIVTSEMMKNIPGLLDETRKISKKGLEIVFVTQNESVKMNLEKAIPTDLKNNLIRVSNGELAFERIAEINQPRLSLAALEQILVLSSEKRFENVTLALPQGWILSSDGLSMDSMLWKAVILLVDQNLRAVSTTFQTIELMIEVARNIEKHA